MATILKSSIGKKLFMSITGLFLVVFLLLHCTINFFSVIDSINGTYGAADGLFQKGCDFMSLPIVTIMVPVLALGFAIHIIWALWLTWGNFKARGGVLRYEVASKAKADSFAAKNMIYLGIIILLGIAIHLFHFWQHMQLQEFLPNGEPENPYFLLNQTFGSWIWTLVYLVWFAVIFLHLSHGVWSAFHTIGWNNMTWIKRLKVIGFLVACLIVVLFATVAVNACLQANNIIG